MAFTAQVANKFAVGDTVKAYPASNWPVTQLPPAPGSTQVGSAAESTTVASDGTVSYTTLSEDTDYYLTKDGSGVYVRVRPDALKQGVAQVSVQNWPATQAVSGTVSVGNFPATQAVSGTVTANPPTSSTATTTSVAAATSSTAIVASNASRKGLTLTNDSTSACTVKFGTGASSSSYAVPLQAGQYFEMPVPLYTGAIEAIWTTATGNMRVTEW